MRFAVIFIAIAALACTKKAESPPSEAEPSAVAGAPAAPEATEADTEGAATKGADARKLGEAMAAGIAGANEDLPEELQGQTPAVGEPATIKLLEPGEEPRKTLRFEVAPSFAQKIRIDVGTGTQAVVAMLAVRSAEHVVSFDVSMQSGKPEKGGLTRITFAVDDAQIDRRSMGDAKTAEARNQALGSARKLKGSYALSPVGHVADFRIDVPEKASKHALDMADNLRLAILQLTPALPEQPVGNGAKWTAHKAIEQGGLLVNQLSTFELVSRDDGTAELSVSVRQSAKVQALESQGTKYDLKTFAGTASGRLTWRATQLVPSAAAFDSEVIKGLRYTKDARAVGVAVKTDRTVDVGKQK